MASGTLTIDSQQRLHELKVSFLDLSGFHRILMSPGPHFISTMPVGRRETVRSLYPYFFRRSDSCSRGTCTDFNLIYSDHYQGQMLAISDGQELSRMKPFNLSIPWVI